MYIKPILFSLLTLILATVPLENFAQSGNKENQLNNYVKFDFAVGSNIDIPPPSDHKDAGLLGSRPAVAPFLAYKATHLFSKRFGWYAGLRIDIYKEKRAEISGQSHLEKAFDETFGEMLGLISKIKPAFDAGVVYRIERGRWSLLPSVGLGFAGYVTNRNASRTRTDDKGESVKLTYRQDASFLTGNIGLSGNYFLGRKSFIALNAGYQHPLQASTALLVQEINGVETERTAYRTSSAGRNVCVSIGYGFILGGKNRNF